MTSDDFATIGITDTYQLPYASAWGFGILRKVGL